MESAGRRASSALRRSSEQNDERTQASAPPGRLRPAPRRPRGRARRGSSPRGSVTVSPRAWRSASSGLRATLIVTLHLDLGVQARPGTVCRPSVLIGALRAIWSRSTVKPSGRHRLGEVAGRDRAVEHAGLAGLADDDEALAVELLGDGLGFLAALEVAGLELGALRSRSAPCWPSWRAAPCRAAAGSCGHSRRLHLHGFAHLAELGDAFEQDHFHVFSPSVRDQVERGSGGRSRRGRRCSAGASPKTVSARPKSDEGDDQHALGEDEQHDRALVSIDGAAGRARACVVDDGEALQREGHEECAEQREPERADKAAAGKRAPNAPASRTERRARHLRRRDIGPGPRQALRRGRRSWRPIQR